eukprot:3504938-Alexandrium_andersonii.AAC.1
MAGPLPDLEPEDCLELCFTRETAKLAYQGSEGGHQTDPAFLGPAEHLAARVYVQPGKTSQAVAQRDDALLTPEETKQHWTA